jgi:phage terminase small subunit
MALTPKQQAFVNAVREGASNKNAAIAAGYAADSASAAGSRLAKHPDVMAALSSSSVNKIVKARSAQLAQASESPEAVGEPTEAGFDLAQALRHNDPKDFLLAVMNDFGSEAKLRVDAAKALMPFMHQRKGDAGKKQDKQDAAKQAGTGRFGTGAPPLRAVK